MFESSGKNLRMAEFINPVDGKSLIIDTSLAGSNGYRGELINAKKVIPEVAQYADGIVLNPGQLEKVSQYLPGKGGATPIMRLDWTNAFRGVSYPLPVSRVERVMIASPDDGLCLGANAVIMHLLLGFDEDIEAENIADIASCARKCSEINMPFIVDLQLVGPKVNSENTSGVIKLGSGFMVEGGVDGLIIPNPDDETLATLLEFSPIPLIIRSKAEDIIENQNIYIERLVQGSGGLFIGIDLFDNKLDFDAKSLAQKILKIVHSAPSIQGSDE